MNTLEYARRGRTAWWRYLLTVGLALILALVLGAVVMAVLLLTRSMPPDLAMKMTDPGHPGVFFASIGATFTCLLAGLVLAARWVQQKRFTDIVGAWSWRQFGLAAGIWTLVLVVLTLVDMAIAPTGFRVTATPETWSLAALSVLALAPQTFAEEFVFRGFLTQGLFLAFKRPLPAAVLSGLIFGAVHIPNGAPQAVSATVFGILMALLAIRLGGIAFTFGLHLVNNVFGAVVVVSQSDVFRGLPGVLSQSTPQLMWWDTGASALGLVAVTALAHRLTVQQGIGRRRHRSLL
ncbi:CPBP family intramembrane metalloprotease [Phenylobacterium sp. LjRoot225]|uniref:CPBP family intramembrane glutamic endopeptidase n=1 Tax=Phenylobacterium sp. LjRoot225 TaxID=3342285 RepID=UPI003ECC88C4